MKSLKYGWVLMLLGACLWQQPTTAQRIFYSEPDRDDVRNLKFEILGKYGDNYLVYKTQRSRHQIVLFSADMQPKEKVNLDFIPERVGSVDFFTGPNSLLLVYQYQRKSIAYCMGVQLDANGRTIGEPLVLDTTHTSATSESKIYSVIASDDRQKLMVFKMRNRFRDEFQFQTLLLSSTLMPIRRAGFVYVLENNKESIADFYLDNDGNFLFTHVIRPGQREYISKARLSVLRTYDDTVKTYPLTINNVFLDELRIKVDNTNGRYILASFYSKLRRGNIDGLFLAVVNKDLVSPDVERVFEFGDDFRNAARGEAKSAVAFNDFYLKHFIVKKDGGVLMTAESSYSSDRGNNFNRWDNPWMWGSPWGPGGYWGWNPYSPWGWGGWNNPWGWNSFGGAPRQMVRYFADNIMVLSFDKEGMMEWNNIVTKSQFNDNSDDLLSYQIMNSGAELLFLYNEWSRRNPLLAAQSLEPGGKVNRQQPLRSLDKDYQFLIRFGKQVSAREMLVPVMYRNAFCFARIEF
ncbi:MAG TPA: hypothetical protein PKE63_01255 [Lacibacter sp.]|nr:hypothetical protein [Lacibacter sp.]HMO88831.1 hypothetical protein [Lacibacter sp.]HMP85869.1 hypothetical protein [Lacibacter sp.]